MHTLTSFPWSNPRTPVLDDVVEEAPLSTSKENELPSWAQSGQEKKSDESAVRRVLRKAKASSLRLSRLVRNRVTTMVERVRENKQQQVQQQTQQQEQQQVKLSPDKEAQRKIALLESKVSTLEARNNFYLKIMKVQGSEIQSLRGNGDHATAHTLDSKNDKEDAQVTIPFDPTDEVFNDNERDELPRKGWELFKQNVSEIYQKYYKNLSPQHKLYISGALIGASLVGTLTGSGLVVAGAVAAKGVLRGLGSVAAGHAVEGVLRKEILRRRSKNIVNRKNTNFLRKEHLGSKAELGVQLAKYSTIVGTFMLGSLMDTLINSYDAHELVPHTPDVQTVSEVASQPAVETPQESVAQQEEGAQGEHTEQENASGGTLTTPSVTEVTIPPVEVIAKHGQTLTGVLLREGMPALVLPEDLAHLTPHGKQNLILNIINQLTPDQLKDIGVLSENQHVIKAGQKINLTKLAEIVKTMTVTVGGEKVSLVKRALEIA